MHDYLTRIAPLYHGRVDAKTLRRQLMQMLVSRNGDLAPDPLPLLAQYRALQKKAPAVDFEAQPSAEQLALHQLVSNLLRKMPASQRKPLHEQIALQLKTRFRNGSYHSLSQYLLAENPVYLAEFDHPALRDFLSLIYVAACEVLGPVVADRWFGGGIADLRTHQPPMGEMVNRYL